MAGASPRVGFSAREFTIALKCAANLILATPRALILMPSPACDGTSVPTPNVADDRRLEGRSRSWVAGSGRLGASARGKASAMAWSRWPPSGSRCDREGPAQLPGPEREAKVCIGNRNRRTRVPKGNPRTVRSCEPHVTMRLPRRPLKRSPGRVTPPPVAEYGTRVPSH